MYDWSSNEVNCVSARAVGWFYVVHHCYKRYWMGKIRIMNFPTFLWFCNLQFLHSRCRNFHSVGKKHEHWNLYLTFSFLIYFHCLIARIVYWFFKVEFEDCNRWTINRILQNTCDAAMCIMLFLRGFII